MTAQYFKDKWHHKATDIYNGLQDTDTFIETISLVGAVRSFTVVNDLMKVFAELEEYEKCKNLESIKKGMVDGLKLV